MNNNLNNEKASLVGMTKEELRQLCQNFSEPEYRGDQLFHWIYVQRVREIKEMKNLPNKFRNNLEGQFRIPALETSEVKSLQNGDTSKFLFQLSTGEKIESVLMEESQRTTVCLSTQVGCALGCTFCATAKMGFQKNLSAGEIVDQYLTLQNFSKRRISNAVFMGMGEPFMNYKSVVSASKLLNNGDGIQLSARKITISTVGIIPKIIQFANEGWKFKLAISLNGTTQQNRSAIMPITKKYRLNELIDAAKYYYKKSKSFITFEYVLMENETDSKEDAERLIDLLQGLPCKVNIIPYNAFDESYSRPDENQMNLFLNTLRKAPFIVTVRWSKGTDINAGCGQLAVMED